MTIKNLVKFIRAKPAAAAAVLVCLAFSAGGISGWLLRGAVIAGEVEKEQPTVRVVRVVASSDASETLLFSGDLTSSDLPPVEEARVKSSVAQNANASDDETFFDGTENQTGDLVLEEHVLGEDDGGFYITGVVLNKSNVAYDAVQIEFELYNKSLDSYAVLSERSRERIEAGGEWEFTSYIPYTYLKDFSSYRLYNIMGVKGK